MSTGGGPGPIITLKDGELVPFKNVRGRDRAIAFMREQAEGKYAYVGSVEDDYSRHYGARGSGRFWSGVLPLGI